MSQSTEAVPPVRSMEGFGSEELTTPFSYGSVHDPYLRSDTLEQKLKKKYWKTKQTVIQKFGKGQDEFVVAGDVEIDTKLERAYHLQSSCTNLLQAIDAYVNQLKTVSTQESEMGDFLKTWSETEYTNAGEVMQNVGKLQGSDSKNRLNLVPSLLRMRSEFLVFRDSAVRDLDVSIHGLEKARTEYRAALLWMKDVSEKLQNPDYRDQLIRFREAQMMVKESKRRFEKLKVDLGEKIDMVSASRCNLLSRSLPNYQKAVLDYTDIAASGFHQVLVNLRAHHHHQYKVRKLLEEIRDLEAEEIPFERTLAEEDEFSSLKLPEPQRSEGTGANKFQSAESDESLLDLGNEDSGSKDRAANGPGPIAGGASGNAETGKASSAQSSGTTRNGLQERKLHSQSQRPGDPFCYEEVTAQAKINDLVLGGIEAELKALQNEVLQPTSSKDFPLSPTRTESIPRTLPPKEESNKQGSIEDSNDSIEDLLNLDESTDFADDASQPSDTLRSASNGALSQAGREEDALVSEWDDFSSFMPGTRDNTRSPLAGWETEFMQHSTVQPLPKAMSPEKVQQEMPPSSASAPAVAHDITASAASMTTSTTTVVSSSSIQTGNGSQSQSFPADHAANVDELLGLRPGGFEDQSQPSSSASEILSAELKALGISPLSSEPDGSVDSKPSQQSGTEGIDPSLFQMHAQQPAAAAALPMAQGMSQQMFISPLGTTQAPPVFPIQGPMGYLSMPPRFGLVSPGGTGTGVMGTGPGTSTSTGVQMGSPGSLNAAKGKMSKENTEQAGTDKGKSWMNFFAHLDPLANEKA